MADEVLVDGEVYDRGADLVEQHAEDVARAFFLVLTHEGEEFLGVAEGVVGQGGELGSHCAVAVQHCLREPRQAHGELHCAEHAYAHGIAMGEGFAARLMAEGLDGVAKGVAKVEDAACGMVVGIAADDGGLDVGTGGNHVGQHLERAVENHPAQAFIPAGVADQEGLEHLKHAVKQHGVGKGVEKCRFDADNGGLVEKAYLVFAVVEVKGSLAANGSVDHADKGRGDVDVADAALVACCHEAAEIADATTPKVDKDGVAVGVGFEQGLPQLGGDGYVLALFAHGHLHEFRLMETADTRNEVRQAVVVGVFVHKYKEACIVECLASQDAVHFSEC